MNNRWKNYFLKKDGEFKTFWTQYLSEKNKNILMIMGLGFDPRTASAVKDVFPERYENVDFYILQHFRNEYKEIEKYEKSVKKNKKDLLEYLNVINRKERTFIDIILRSNDNRNLSYTNTNKIIQSIDQIERYTDIIIDISAIPTGVYFTLVNKLLTLIDSQAKKKINLHIVVTENSMLDSIIIDELADENASCIKGFGGIITERTKDMKSIWMPILGENKEQHLKILNTFTGFDEICPVLPFPSYNIRRGDELIANYYETLKIENTNNIIYADEQNPFQVYRLLRDAIYRYTETFQILNGCKIMLSALSSKLLSLGVLLAAYDSKNSLPKYQVGVLHLEPYSYNVNGGESKLQEFNCNSSLFELWLTGEPYGT